MRPSPTLPDSISQEPCVHLGRKSGTPERRRVGSGRPVSARRSRGIWGRRSRGIWEKRGIWGEAGDMGRSGGYGGRRRGCGRARGAHAHARETTGLDTSARFRDVIREASLRVRNDQNLGIPRFRAHLPRGGRLRGILPQRFIGRHAPAGSIPPGDSAKAAGTPFWIRLPAYPTPAGRQFSGWRGRYPGGDLCFLENSSSRRRRASSAMGSCSLMALAASSQSNCGFWACTRRSRNCCF